MVGAHILARRGGSGGGGSSGSGSSSDNGEDSSPGLSGGATTPGADEQLMRLEREMRSQERRHQQHKEEALHASKRLELELRQSRAEAERLRERCRELVRGPQEEHEALHKELAWAQEQARRAQIQERTAVGEAEGLRRELVRLRLEPAEGEGREGALRQRALELEGEAARLGEREGTTTTLAEVCARQERRLAAAVELGLVTAVHGAGGGGGGMTDVEEEEKEIELQEALGRAQRQHSQVTRCQSQRCNAV
jgi:hypothetical protein